MESERETNTDRIDKGREYANTSLHIKVAELSGSTHIQPLHDVYYYQAYWQSSRHGFVDTKEH